MKTLLNKKRWMLWLILFLFLTMLALLNFTRFVTSRLAEGEPPYFKHFFIMETTGAYTILFVLPFALWFIKKFPITRKNMVTHIPLQVLASMVYGITHTMLMFGSRNFIFWLFNWGTYNYGRFIYKIPMEYSHQFFTYCIIYGIVIFNKYIRENQEQKIRASRLEQQLTRARLQALQMQLQPHFLFNTLNMISATMYDNVKMADSMIASLSDLLRITLNSTGADEHPLEQELVIVNLYIDIMKARFRDKLIVKTDIEESSREALVPGFILQPLVENSIKFSMKRLKTVEISITSRTENGKLRLIIKDNGPGVPGEIDRLSKNGIGLSNTVERLEQLYGKNHRFELRNRGDGGLEVLLEIPYRK